MSFIYQNLSNIIRNYPIVEFCLNEAIVSAGGYKIKVDRRNMQVSIKHDH